MNKEQIATALINIENEGPEWLEWCAALYESYAADNEVHGPTAGRRSRAHYSAAAHLAAEQIERDTYGRLENARYRTLYGMDYSGQ